MEAPLLIEVSSPPLRFLFEPICQRLALVELTEPARFASYKGETIKVDEGAATRRGMARLFGPTLAPEDHPSHSEEQVFGISWDRVWLLKSRQTG